MFFIGCANESLEQTGDAGRKAGLGNSKIELRSNSVSKTKSYDLSMMKSCDVSKVEDLRRKPKRSFATAQLKTVSPHSNLYFLER